MRKIRNIDLNTSAEEWLEKLKTTSIKVRFETWWHKYDDETSVNIFELFKLVARDR